MKVVNIQRVQKHCVLTNFIQQLTSAIFLVETTLDNTFISRNIFREKLWALLAILAVIFLPDWPPVEKSVGQTNDGKSKD